MLPPDPVRAHRAGAQSRSQNSVSGAKGRELPRGYARFQWLQGRPSGGPDNAGDV